MDARALIDALSPERREALILTQILGYTYEEAARIADVRVGTIRSRVARARKELIDATEAQILGIGAKPERRECGHGKTPAIRFYG